ncbi:MAG: ABC-type multidrug transport system permease component [Bacteroidetes bacterium]|nr:ABC-type multidrug transport system permease component [Bacteroidota bacterium]
MRKSLEVILEIMKKEFYQVRRDKKMLVVSIVAPFVQVLLLGYAATTDIKNTTMVVCDQDKTEESRGFIREFSNSGYFIIRYVVNTPPEVDPYVEHARASIALVIPAGFARDLLSRKTTEVQVVLDGADANTANILLTYATQIVASYSQSVVARYATRIAGRSIPRILPEPRVWFNPDLLSSNFMVPGVVALVLMIITMTLTSLGIVKEKEMGTLEQLMVTPIKPHELILGKLIPFSLIGFLDVVIVLALARFWFKVPLLGSVPLLFGLSVLFILTTLGLGLWISTIAKSQQQAMLIAQFFFFMPFIFLSGFAFPIANMPQVIQYVTYLIPLRYFLEILRGIFLKGAGLNELWPQAMALLAMGVVVLTVSVLRFQKKLE